MSHKFEDFINHLFPEDLKVCLWGRVKSPLLNFLLHDKSIKQHSAVRRLRYDHIINGIRSEMLENGILAEKDQGIAK